MLREYSFLYTGYLLGYMTTKKVSEWADKELLLNSIIPDELLIDISLCDDENKMISLLSKFVNDNMYLDLDYYLSLYNFLGNTQKLSYYTISIEMLSAFRVCNYSFMNTSYQESDEKYGLFFTRLSDYIELKKDNLMGNMKMPNELISFLSNYNKDIQVFKDLKFNVKGVEII